MVERVPFITYVKAKADGACGGLCARDPLIGGTTRDGVALADVRPLNVSTRDIVKGRERSTEAGHSLALPAT